MSRDQFISWLKGFTAAVEETPTKGQWETIVSELNKIQECTDWSSPIGVPYTPPTWQDPYFPNPLDKFKITCDDNGLIGGIGVTNSGDNISNISTNGSTSITTKLFPGTTLNYTIKDDSKDS